MVIIDGSLLMVIAAILSGISGLWRAFRMSPRCPPCDCVKGCSCACSRRFDNPP